ncbi:MAG TPA: cytochrome b/b6 domain-containing protein [Dongiaceae bacterium]|jgi:cytochrome b
MMLNSAAQPTVRIRIWDPFVRLFHWLLVIGIGFCWWSGETGRMDLHYQCGLVVLGLVIFRILWGLLGSPSARFSHFLKGPGAVIAYLRHIMLPKPSHSFGHNAAGGAMVMGLLLAILVQTVSGLFNTDDIVFDGPFYGKVPEWFSDKMGFIHDQLFNPLLALIGLHIAVILFYRLWKRENLVAAMITGRARLPQGVAERAEKNGETRFASPLKAVLLVVIAAAIPAAIYWLN